MVTLWQHGTFTCLITPADEDPPYWVVVHESGEPISGESFDTYVEAHTHASGELRHAIAAENPHDQ